MIKSLILVKENLFCIKRLLPIFEALLYCILLITSIRWGIPNVAHPYNYQMDEWHTFMSVKSVFKYGTAAIEGSAHGPIFYYFLSGVFLIPFYLLEVVNPFEIKSGLDSLAMLERIFIILRINTLVYGILSICVLKQIIEKYFKFNYAIGLIFFIFTPIWLCLSNYFKYDIALVFWILIFLFFSLKYSESRSKKDYLLSGISCALAVATKISGFPLFLGYFFAYFLFTPAPRKNFSVLMKGILLSLLLFLIVGIPDIFFKAKKYYDFILANVSMIPSETINIKTGLHYWLFVLLKQIPTNYGYTFSMLFAISFVYFSFVIIKSFSNRQIKSARKETFLYFCLFFFGFSLIPLKIYSVGNRSLVLLPFMVILMGIFLQKIWNNRKRPKRAIIRSIVLIGIVLQVCQSLSYYSVKLFPDPRKVSSVWIEQNIPRGTIIGIENVPIYQMLPDVTLKEFYTLQSNPKAETLFRYELIDFSATILPSVVIVTNERIAQKYLLKSAKNDLIARLEKEGYIRTQLFEPNWKFYKYFGNELNFYIGNLIPSSTITIFEEKR